MQRISFLKNYLLLKQLSRNKSSSKNVLFGGYIREPPERRSVSKLLYERLRDPSRADKILQICSETKAGLTTQNFLKQCVGVAEGLREKNVRKGDYILVVGNNSLNMNVALAGILISGAVAVPISYFANPDDLRHLLTYIRPKFFICDGHTLFTIRRIVSSVLGQIDEKMVVLLNDCKYQNTDLQCFPQFIDGKGNDWDSFKPAEVKDPNTELVFVMKSLAEGAANRGVMLTHANVLAVISRYEVNKAKELSTAVILMVQKIIWMSGIYSVLLSCLFGATLIVMRDFDEEHFMKCIETYKVTASYLYPTKLWQLYKYNYPRKYDLSSCKSIYAVGANVPPLLIDLIRERVGLTVRSAYGLTEMSGIIIEPSGVDKPGSYGKLVPMCYAKVVDAKTNQKFGPNVPGELCFKGPTLMKGYINDEKAMRDLIDKEGFLHTGIYGYYDKDEEFFILDRVKEVIRYLDKEVSPFEIEGVLKSHDAVKDCVVSGIAHPKDGYYAVAFVVLQPGKTATAEELTNFVASKLPEHKHLKGGVVFIPKVPRSRESGFIRRSAIHKILSKYRLVLGRGNSLKPKVEAVVNGKANESHGKENRQSAPSPPSTKEGIN